MRAWFDAELTAESPREINVATEHPGAPMGYVMLDRGNTNEGVYHYQSGVDGDQPERDEIEWWGMAPIVYALERVARRWADDGNPRIQIGDMTRPQGGTYWRLTGEEYVDDGREDYVSGGHVRASANQLSRPRADGNEYRIDHGTHKRGWVADIRPMVSSEEDVGQPLTTESDMYDRALSHAFVQMLHDEAPKDGGESMLSRLLFGDEEMTREQSPYYSPFVIENSAHANHYHVQARLHLEWQI